ncbi:hypothetical protein GTW51_16020 [Aurantimonas aggregata]|uniref:Molybdenum cofactor carrier n=2 Tax=Aurantimonas aggregata TaxID=2047720 RepID=A0A6L9MKX4_9HYPH|nr:hypothetical protein [Aurantimonas aggregata]
MQSEHVGKLRGPTDKPIRIEYVAMPRSIIVGTMRQAVHKIVSGGQTGVDRAALDVALELGISIGGWVPKGRLAEDGELSVRYRDLVESDESSSELRTRLNVGSSDSTLVLTTANKSKGTELTILTAGNFSKPVCVVNVDKSDVSIREAANEIRDWLQIQKPIVLNVAGPRASEWSAPHFAGQAAVGFRH